MKHIKMIVTFSLLLVAISASGQSIPKITADIPFAFNVGETTLKAGEYSLGSHNLPRGVLLVHNWKTHQNAAAISMPKYARGVSDETKLLFHRYRGEGGEDKYFLAQMWVEGNTTGFELPISRLEKETAKKAAKRDMITLVVPAPKQRSAD